MKDNYSVKGEGMNRKLVAVIITSLAMTHSLQPLSAMEVHERENAYTPQVDVIEEVMV